MVLVAWKQPCKWPTHNNTTPYRIIKYTMPSFTTTTGRWRWLQLFRSRPSTGTGGCTSILLAEMIRPNESMRWMFSGSWRCIFAFPEPGGSGQVAGGRISLPWDTSWGARKASGSRCHSYHGWPLLTNVTRCYALIGAAVLNRESLTMYSAIIGWGIADKEKTLWVVSFLCLLAGCYSGSNELSQHWEMAMAKLISSASKRPPNRFQVWEKVPGSRHPKGQWDLFRWPIHRLHAMGELSFPRPPGEKERLHEVVGRMDIQLMNAQPSDPRCRSQGTDSV